MDNKIRLTKTITAAGTVIVWLPILFAIMTGMIGSIVSRTLRFDYLMPAELFPLSLAGGLLLIWAARRAQFYKSSIGWSLAAMAGFLAASQTIAVLTGLASGEHAPTGWRIMLVSALLALYILANVSLSITGVCLFRKL